MPENISVEEKIWDDYPKAFKERKRNETVCLRLLRAEIKNKEIQKKDTLNEQEIIQIIRTNLKEELESLDFFVIRGK